MTPLCIPGGATADAGSAADGGGGAGACWSQYDGGPALEQLHCEFDRAVPGEPGDYILYLDATACVVANYDAAPNICAERVTSGPEAFVMTSAFDPPPAPISGTNPSLASQRLNFWAVGHESALAPDVSGYAFREPLRVEGVHEARSRPSSSRRGRTRCWSRESMVGSPSLRAPAGLGLRHEARLGERLQPHQLLVEIEAGVRPGQRAIDSKDVFDVVAAPQTRVSPIQ
jgi:hypothetical protein